MVKLYTTLFYCCLFFSVSYSQFQSDGGPWFASHVRDIAIGYSGGNSIIYAVNMSESGITRTLVKSTDGGLTWIHLSSLPNPVSVATQINNPNIV